MKLKKHHPRHLKKHHSMSLEPISDEDRSLAPGDFVTLVIDALERHDLGIIVSINERSVFKPWVATVLWSPTQVEQLTHDNCESKARAS